MTIRLASLVCVVSMLTCAAACSESPAARDGLAGGRDGPSSAPTPRAARHLGQLVLSKFDRVYVGWEHYQQSSQRTLWIDDLALSDQRIGCPP